MKLIHSTSEATSNLPAISTGSVRDVRLDAIRGFLLILMTVDHIPGVIGIFTREFGGYVSAAEGFVFLSGFVAGLIYARVSFEQGIAGMYSRAWLRARTIYAYHVCTFVFVLIFICGVEGNEEYRKSWEPIMGQSYATSILLGMSFAIQPAFLDLLPMYCVFLFMVPLAIKQLRAGNQRLVLGGSFLAWTLAQTGFVDELVPALQLRVPVHLGSFDIFAWQFLFTIGLYFGYLRHVQADGLRRSKFLFYYAGLMALTFFLTRHGLLMDETKVPGFATLIDKKHLGVLRLFNAAVVFYLIGSLQSRWEPGHVFKGLAYLGRHSLQVYAFHVVLVCYLYALLERVAQWSTGASILLTVACVCSLFIPACLDEIRMRQSLRPRQANRSDLSSTTSASDLNSQTKTVAEKQGPFRAKTKEI